MPLLDHFHPPLSERRPWESFHATWCGSLADLLNEEVLPQGYIALEQINPGAAIEIDVGTFGEHAEPGSEQVAGGTTTLPQTVWTPATAPLMLPCTFPDRHAVEIHSTEGGRTLVAAIELVSPGNKDRAEKRRLFAAKCAAYLARGIGLIILDIVTSRHANLHNELITLLAWDSALQMRGTSGLYTVAYRPLQRDQTAWIEAWPMPLIVGQTLPQVPLSLSAESCVALDLETAYTDACRRRRVEEARE